VGGIGCVMWAYMAEINQNVFGTVGIRNFAAWWLSFVMSCGPFFSCFVYARAVIRSSCGTRAIELHIVCQQQKRFT
jgi:hypothetical protein